MEYDDANLTDEQKAIYSNSEAPWNKYHWIEDGFYGILVRGGNFTYICTDDGYCGKGNYVVGVEGEEPTTVHTSWNSVLLKIPKSEEKVQVTFDVEGGRKKTAIVNLKEKSSKMLYILDAVGGSWTYDVNGGYCSSWETDCCMYESYLKNEWHLHGDFLKKYCSFGMPDNRVSGMVFLDEPESNKIQNVHTLKITHDDDNLTPEMLAEYDKVGTIFEVPDGHYCVVIENSIQAIDCWIKIEDDIVYNPEYWYGDPDCLCIVIVSNDIKKFTVEMGAVGAVTSKFVVNLSKPSNKRTYVIQAWGGALTYDVCGGYATKIVSDIYCGFYRYGFNGEKTHGYSTFGIEFKNISTSCNFFYNVNTFTLEK
jgi:hypothetical protein